MSEFPQEYAPQVETIAAMASRGAAKMRAREPVMKANWEAARPTMISNFERLPFGPSIKQNYRTMLGRATYRVDAAKWQRRWSERIAR